MKNRYILEVLTYTGSFNREIEADDFQINESVIKFVSDGGDRWIPIAVYPADKTIVTKIEKLK